MALNFQIVVCMTMLKTYIYHIVALDVSFHVLTDVNWLDFQKSIQLNFYVLSFTNLVRAVSQTLYTPEPSYFTYIHCIWCGCAFWHFYWGMIVSFEENLQNEAYFSVGVTCPRRGFPFRSRGVHAPERDSPKTWHTLLSPLGCRAEHSDCL